MKIEEFLYEKNGDKKKYRVLPLYEDERHLKGISLESLTEDEIGSLIKIKEEYEEKYKPFLKKAFRQFVKNKITRLNS